MTKAVREMPFMGDASNMADGLLTMHEMFSKTGRPEIQQIAILLTGDASNVDSARTVPEATAAKDDGIYILVLGKTLMLKLCFILPIKHAYMVNMYKSCTFIQI